MPLVTNDWRNDTEIKTADSAVGMSWQKAQERGAAKEDWSRYNVIIIIIIINFIRS